MITTMRENSLPLINPMEEGLRSNPQLVLYCVNCVLSALYERAFVTHANFYKMCAVSLINSLSDPTLRGQRLY
jgi:hypothetical protein